MMKYLQRIGKSLMLPVAVLPAAAILYGIGYWIDPFGWGANNVAAAFLIKSASAIVDKLPILFAVGVAIGMAKTKDGASALSGLVAYLMVTTLLSSETVAMLQGVEKAMVNPAFGKIENAFIGILSGVIAAACFNKFGNVKLPSALSFFSGRRSVPIVTSVVMMFVSVILFFIWPAIYSALVYFGQLIVSLGPIGAGIYAFFNRLLIPTGLHHALNSVFWFDVAGISDINKFWGTIPGGVKGITGIYQAGFFPIMMFGLPAAALAMYHTAKDNKKKVTFGLLLAGAFASFFSGVTEPIEFAFMFLAPGLYFVHALLTGLSVYLAAHFGWTAGFMFSAGFVDFFLSSRLPLANKPFMLLILGLIFGAAYYILFRFLIVKFNLNTPGREEDEISEKEMNTKLANDDYYQVAKTILEGLGGKDNVVSVDNCITRLRIEVTDITLVNDKKIKSAGVAGIIKPGKTSVQIIIGTQVQFVADELNKLL
ncbi:N-acetylglucosamine-specific PTS transporter subunit IIBC [Clostridium polynesiense]|uniref:N-acetylglucosamine-specific PTS transporter subunit IIBC n=1 Tax=Clostridium polynesiense TaxID=1325933 RepID=UPI00058BB2A7|nr:N-acetylglucosamine-specific PTS transporter subunit IIBC [Clostridium polynesiense]